MNLLQLEGIVDMRDQELATLRRQLAQLDEALRLERIKTGAIEAGVRKLRSSTLQLFRALQLIHGQIDETGIDAQVANDGPAANSKWDAIKQRNPGRIAEAIDTLLVHGAMSVSQLAAAMRMDRSNCSRNVAGKLMRMGLVVRNGNALSLKTL